MRSIISNWKYKKPNWKSEFEFYENELSKQTGLSKQKLNEIIDVFVKYGILKDEG